MKEIWREIPEYSGLYEASNLGRIRSVEGKVTSSARFKKRVWKQRIIKQKFKYSNKGKRKDAMVSLWKDGKPYTHLVSRLIASTFCGDNLNSDLTVNHIDGNPMNNNVENLEWISKTVNIKYGFNVGQYDRIMKPVKLVSGMSTMEFNSMAEADWKIQRVYFKTG